MLKKHFPVLLVFGFALLGCASFDTVESTKVLPGDIFQEYTVTCSDKTTSAYAAFRVGSGDGATIDLDQPSKVSHNEHEMNENKPFFFKGTDYRDTAEGFVGTHKFNFFDSSGKVWHNEISIAPLKITDSTISVSKAKGGKFALSRPVEKDENVEFMIVSDKEEPIASNSNSNAPSKTPEKEYSTKLQVSIDELRQNVSIEPFSLNKFVEGGAKIHVTVKRNKGIQESAKGGTISISYDSSEVVANVGN